MQDLNVIAAQNARAIEGGIKSYQNQGRWVVATYTGVTLASIETFSDAPSAEAAAKAAPPSPDVRYKLFTPTPGGKEIATRDQSEDRTATA